VNNHMMAAVLYGKEHLQVEPVAVPTIESGDILVRVKVALTCGTDVKVFRRGYHARMIVPPAVFGHELAGDVVAIGEDVTNFSIGQRVVAANSAPCGDCFFCHRGLENLCEDLLFNNGAYAEYIRIPRRIVDLNTLVIPPHVSFEEAAMVDGDSRLGALRRVVLPLVTPGLAATAVFCLIVSWNEFLFALVLTQTDAAMTLPVGIAGRVTQYGIKWGAMSAAAVVAMIPILAFAMSVQKYLVRGLSLGAGLGVFAIGSSTTIL